MNKTWRVSLQSSSNEYSKEYDKEQTEQTILTCQAHIIVYANDLAVLGCSKSSLKKAIEGKGKKYRQK